MKREMLHAGGTTMKGLVKLAKPKAPRVRKGLDDPTHLQAVRKLPCLLRGKTCQLTRWIGVHPHKREVTESYKHLCIGAVEAHHVVSKGRRGADLGNLAPMCRGSHSELHQIGQKAFEARWNLDLQALAKE